MLNILRQYRQRLIVEFTQSQIGERHTRQIHYRGSADFCFAVNMIDISARIFGNSFPRQSQHLLPGSIHDCAGRTDLGANRLFTLSNPLIAESTFTDFRSRIVKFKAGHIKGTGHHTITTADAFAGIISNGAVPPLLQRTHRAGRHAGGLITMHTLAFNKIHERPRRYTS